MTSTKHNNYDNYDNYDNDNDNDNDNFIIIIIIIIIIVSFYYNYNYYLVEEGHSSLSILAVTLSTLTRMKRLTYNSNKIKTVS